MASETRTDPWLGRQIGHRDRYRLDRNVGGGGMGDVYLATDLMLGKQVALKLLKEGLVDHADLRQRFDREITISAALGSEHIVQVTDHGITSEGNPFFVMEYLKGESLGSLLKRQKRIPFARAMRIILQVCTGLQVAHRGVQMMRRDGSSPGDLIKVIHRDLKPDNIFLTPHEIWGDWVKILDFGIAKIRSDQLTEINKTLSGSFLGTMRYAAPEQWQGKDDIDVRADLYSLGVLFYEMVSGTDPFGLQSHSRPVDPTSWLMAHITTPAQSLRLQNDCSHIPAEVDEIFLRCLAKDPADRFADAGELQVALKNVSESLIYSGVNPGDDTTPDRNRYTTPGPQVELPPEDSLPPTTDQPSGATSGIVGLTAWGRAPTAAPTSLGTRKLWVALIGGVVLSVVAIGGGLMWQRAQPPDIAGDPSPSPTPVLSETLTPTPATSNPATPTPVTPMGSALAAASNDNLVVAIAMAQRISTDAAEFEAAQSLLATWGLELAQDHITEANYSQALTVLNGIPADQAESTQANTLAQNLEQLIAAQTQAQEGLLQEAIASAYPLPGQGLIAEPAEALVCTSMVTLLERDFRREVDLAAGGEAPPLFGNYQVSACRTAPLRITTDILRMENRDDDNFKIIALVMAGFLWENLPATAHERLGRGEVLVEFMEQGSQVAQVTLTNPSLIPETSSNFEQVFASLRLQRL